jgi:hypothetical protein
MKILIAIPLLALCACSADHDSDNGQVTIQYDEEQARETASDVGNSAEKLGGAIADGAEDAANAVRNTDVDVNVNTDGGDASANSQ